MSDLNGEEIERVIYPRPIHSVHREINDRPNATEPQRGRSSEHIMDDSYFAKAEQFHQKHGGNFKLSSSRRKTSHSLDDLKKAESAKNNAKDSFKSKHAISDNRLDEYEKKNERVTSITKKLQFERINSEFQESTRKSFPGRAKEQKPLTKFYRHKSSSSLSKKDAKRDAKNQSKKMANARRAKHDNYHSDVQYGFDHTEDDIFIFDNSDVSDGLTISSSYALTEDDSVEYHSDDDKYLISTAIHRQLDQVRNSSGKKKLILKDMNLCKKDIPVDFICAYPFGEQLHKLSLSGNNLISLPDQITLELINLSTLDVSQCRLRTLPKEWYLPNLKILNLSHNRIEEFFDEGALSGIPNLEHLDMFDNQIHTIFLPEGNFLQKLVFLNLDFNNLTELPDDLHRLNALKTIKVSNNLLTHVGRLICEMNLTELIVTPNPLIQPPVEDCERGIHGMRRYYNGLMAGEKNNSSNAIKKSRRNQKKKPKGNFVKPKESNISILRKKDETDETSISRILIKPETQIPATSSVREPKVLQQLEKKPIVQNKISSGATSSSIYLPSSVATGTRSVDLENNSRKSIHSPNQDAVNDTLKVIFVGEAYAGKTTIIKRLKEGKHATIPKVQERTIGVNIHEWNPKLECDTHGIDTSNFKTQIIQENKSTSAPVDIKFSMWDFAGQNEYLASHEIFFSSRALYILVWDMAYSNKDVMVHKKPAVEEDDGPFRLDDSSSEEDSEYFLDKEARRADRALGRDIDEKVQFWVNCIQSCVPGAVILPIATYDDYFDTLQNGSDEGRRRCEKMFKRLMQNEKSRINGIMERLEKLKLDNRANSCEACRLRQLLSSYNRPKLIFNDTNSLDRVMRVSGKDNRGIDEVRAKIINLATGIEIPANNSYPLFQGHLGSPIPTIRLRIREFVRKTRKSYHVISYDHFIYLLQEELGIKKDNDIGNICDALQFLTSIGELSYFGECQTIEGIPATCKGSIEVDTGLSDFIFLNPKWLALAIGCILRHDLTEEINLQRGLNQRSEESPWQDVGRGGSNFHAANKNVPVITFDDACMLWKAKKRIVRAAEPFSDDSSLSPYEFLINLLVHFDILVSIDLKMEAAVFGGHDYSTHSTYDYISDPSRVSLQYGGQQSSEANNVSLTRNNINESKMFFVPSLLGQARPPENVWTYKCNEAWKTCLCQSWYFPDNVPPGLMNRVTASVLRAIHGNLMYTPSGKDNGVSMFLRFRRIFSWRTALNISLGHLVRGKDDDYDEIRIEIWVHLIEKESDQCVATDVMGVGTRRLIVSAKGPEGNYCRNIWHGGYGLVLQTVNQVVTEYSGLEYQRQYVCPRCLSSLTINQAKVWNGKDIQASETEENGIIFCGNAHGINIQAVDDSLSGFNEIDLDQKYIGTDQTISSEVPFTKLFKAVVLVGIWDAEKEKIINVGSGFIVDRKRGLIVTAAHVIADMNSGSKTFGSLYYGLNDAKIVIGIPIESNNGKKINESPIEARFRYIADVVAHDMRNMDACVLRISQRLKQFVTGSEDSCFNQATDPASQDHFLEDNIQRLRWEKCEYEEKVRILGYNQGGEGLTKTPKLNRVLDVANGSVVKIHNARDILEATELDKNSFNPRGEIVVNCSTIGGHSGGPCVNQEGKVIGILSRSDAVDKHRCYLVPSSEIKKLVKLTILWEDQLHLGKLLEEFPIPQ